MQVSTVGWYESGKIYLIYDFDSPVLDGQQEASVEFVDALLQQILRLLQSHVLVKVAVERGEDEVRSVTLSGHRHLVHAAKIIHVEQRGAFAFIITTLKNEK